MITGRPGARYILHKQEYFSENNTKLSCIFWTVCQGNTYRAIAMSCLIARRVCTRLSLSQIYSMCCRWAALICLDCRETSSTATNTMVGEREILIKLVSWRRKWVKWGWCHQVYTEVNEKEVIGKLDELEGLCCRNGTKSTHLFGAKDVNFWMQYFNLGWLQTAK